MNFKRITLAIGFICLASIGIATATYATYQTIADIPAPQQKPKLQIRLKAENFEPNHTYRIILENGDVFETESNSEGQIDTVQFIPEVLLEKKLISFRVEPIGDTDNNLSELSISIDLGRQKLKYEGKLLHPSDTVILQNSSMMDLPASKVATDWSGKFSMENSWPASLKPGQDICMETTKTDTSFCFSFNVINPVGTTEVLMPSTFNLVFSGAISYLLGITLTPYADDVGAISDDPYSVFDVWTKPVDCKPYKTELSTCNDSHMMSVFDESWRKPIYDMQRMTLQISALMMQQVGFIGSLIDAKIQLETQLLFWQKQEEAHDTYHPSEQMCTITTLTKGLASTDAMRELNTYGMARAFSFDDFSQSDTTTSYGHGEDKSIRFLDFKNRYCNPKNLNGLLAEGHYGVPALCDSLTHGDVGRVDRDMDYSRLIEIPKTLSVDVTDGTNSSADEEDIIAMSRLLFAKDTWDMPRGNEDDIRDILNDPDLFRHNYQKYRSISAMRNVGRYSFANIVGMKAKGSELSDDYVHAVLQQFGMPASDIERFVGENPSYFAQMSVLTKQLFQHPTFYTDLIDKPANVLRFETTMEALKLMHDRERFEASLRKEMLLSLVVEMKLRQYQETDVDSNLKKLDYLSR